MQNKYLKDVVTLKLNNESCNGCGKCTEVCPHNVFKIEAGKANVVNRDSCMECGACSKNCPFSAITVRPGVGCAYGIIRSTITKGESCC